MIDDLLAGKAQDLGEQREMGFQMIMNAMLEAYAKKIKSNGKISPLVRTSMFEAYHEGLKDMKKVFSQIVEEQGMSEIG